MDQLLRGRIVEECFGIGTIDGSAGGIRDLIPDEILKNIEAISINGSEPLPGPKLLLLADVRSQSRSMSVQIFDQYKCLRNIVANWETHLEKRWLKRTREQRKAILLRIWPGMASVHRPDYDAWKKNIVRESVSFNRSNYLWPYINQEDLLKPKNRSHYRFGLVTNTIDIGFLNEHVMMFTDRHTPETYGQLISWNEHPAAFDWLISERGLSPGDGLVVLEVQARLYKFCVDCCKELMHDMATDELERPTLTITPEPVSISKNEVGHVSLAAAAAEAPYRVPSSLNFDRLESELIAKLEAAEDHLLALREDPGYFAEQMIAANEHRAEHVLDYLGQKHPLINNKHQAQTDKLWQGSVKNVVLDAYINIEMWNSLYKQMDELTGFKEKYANDIFPGEDLPEEYAMTFYKFIFLLRKSINGAVGVLMRGVFGSPPIRGFFERHLQNSNDTGVPMQVQTKTNLPKDKIRTEFIGLFRDLCDKKRRSVLNLGTLLDELHRLLELEPTARQLVTSWTAERISDLHVLSLCVQQVELYYPWAATFEEKMGQHVELLEKNFGKFWAILAPLLQIEISVDIVSLGKPSGTRFYYPIDTRRTLESTRDMRVAEQNLDAFWNAVDAELARKGAITARTRALLLNKPPQRTSEWTEPPKPKRKYVTAADHSLNNSTEQIFLLESATQNTLVENCSPTKTSKPKTKTRGPTQQVGADPVTPQQPKQLNLTPSLAPFTQIKVDRRAFKTFRTIFFTPSTTSQPGEVHWTDFLHAMSSVGFEIEKQYGSAWQFTPSGNMHVERPISIHEPHPVSKLAFRVARRIGRRLGRIYGWESGSFVV